MKYLILCIGLLSALTLNAQQPCAADLFNKTLKFPITGYYSTTSAIDVNGNAYIAAGEFLSKFSVFNRFGQLVFHSTTPGEGWDGSIKGKGQDSNNFSWMCRYRFQGGPPQFKKGRVVLIR